MCFSREFWATKIDILLDNWRGEINSQKHQTVICLLQATTERHSIPCQKNIEKW